MKRREFLHLLKGSSSLLAITLFACASESLNSLSITEMKLESSAFSHNQSIPSQYTCDGKNVSPPLAWSQPPEGTKSLVLICDDPDAPRKTWVHWVVYNLPPTVHSLPENICPSNPLPKVTVQGVNDFGTTTYGGPCPPSGTHRYFFKLYALDRVLELPEGATKAQVESAMQGHILAQAELIGLYHR